MRAPQTSHDAAAHVDRWRAKHNRVNRIWRARDKAHATAEHLYRGLRAKAYISHQDARSADVREALVYDHRIGADEATQAAGVAESVGLAGLRPETVGDLRFLRDLCRSMAERAKQAVRDSADELDAWRGVLSMSRAEAELSRNSPGGGEQ